MTKTSIIRTVLPAALCLTAQALAQTAPEAVPEKTLFSQFIIAGGPIVWIVLLPMSLATIYLAVDLLLGVSKKRLVPANISQVLQRDFAQLPRATFVGRLKKSPDMVSRSIYYTFLLSHTLKQHVRYIHQLAAESISRQALPIQRKIEWCSIIGNVAPMVGLFGTVFGMIKAFNILGIAGGQPRPDQLAAAISIALVTTFWGLLVAIPALAVHGIFSSRLDNIMSQAAIETENVLRAIGRETSLSADSVLNDPESQPVNAAP